VAVGLHPDPLELTALPRPLPGFKMKELRWDEKGERREREEGNAKGKQE